MEAPKPKISKSAAGLWVITGILAISCGAYALLSQDKSSLSKDTAQEKPVPQSQNNPQTRDDTDSLDSRGADDFNSEQQAPPDGAQAPMGGHNMSVPPGAPPLKDVKEP